MLLYHWGRLAVRGRHDDVSCAARRVPARSMSETMVRHARGDRKILKIFPSHMKKLCSDDRGRGIVRVWCYPDILEPPPPRGARPSDRGASWLTTLCGS
ncbi:hypothetical protein C6P97_28020 [Burkholderia multivorans]|uniref:Uncharacterized protein n=1 Tax=Burkholderia multivorans TaxID=87883 RepID=A0AB37AVW0_9BURK|nr:hypothetical protein C6P97_28020 [Burkholderia multivorans]PRE52518.1 hypothetical protein C6P99_08175 [Burkholderia multivorans]